MHKVLQPATWVKPIGYSNGIEARGRQIFVGGQVGWNPQCVFESDELVDQVKQTLTNIVDILATAGAEPAHITNMTWFLIDKKDYLKNLSAIGRVYREIMGTHYPAMAALQVSAFIEDRAKVEIQATAVIPDP